MSTLNTNINRKLKEWGASLVGFGDLSELPSEMRGDMPFGISIGVAADASTINEISAGPTLEYYEEYNRLNRLLSELCNKTVDYLIDCGYSAKAVEPTVSKSEMNFETLSVPVSHKMVATRAGLGWIGKSDLLINKKYGPAVRYASVLTDAELITADPIRASKCGDCQECVKSCPAKAIVGQNWNEGMKREQLVDAFRCSEMAMSLSQKAGFKAYTCGICINVCPWSRKYLSGELGT